MAQIDGLETMDGTLLYTEDGDEVVEYYFIKDLVGYPQSRKFQALYCPGIPRKFDPHPFDPNIYVSAVNVLLLDQDRAKVSVKYLSPKEDKQKPDDTGKCLIDVGATVQEVTSNMDVNGDPIIVSYDYIEFDNQGNRTETNVQETGEVKFQQPMVVIRLTRRETESPFERSKYYTGKVNLSEAFGDPPGWWLCTKLEGSSKDGDETYDVDYEFQRKVNGWTATAVFIDPETNAPPEDAQKQTDAGGDAIVTVQIYYGAEFNDLNIEI